MAVTITWKVNNMRRNSADGGVFLVNWSCQAQNEEGPENATASGNYVCEPDTSASDFVAYEDLTEEIVLGWVKASNFDGATAAELEEALTQKVNSQILRNSQSVDGMPW